MQEAKSPRAQTLGGLIGAGLVAHGAASLAGAVAFMAFAQVANPSMETLGTVPLVALVILVAGFPGFALLRIALHLSHRTAWPWFIAAGAANGALFGVVVGSASRHPFDTADAMILSTSTLVGGIAGAVYRWVERGLLTPQEGRE